MTETVRNQVRAAGLSRIGNCDLFSPHDGDADAGERGGCAIYTGDAGARRDQDDAGLAAGEHPCAQGHSNGDAPGQADPSYQNIQPD